jgi:hypothetical protein
MGLFNRIFGSKQPAPSCEIHPDDRTLVRPDDIVWWNSLSLVDCRQLEEGDNVFRLASFQKFMETDRLTEVEAGKKVRLSFPTFYWRLEHRADEKFKLEADDAKLPYVLKDRINRAVIRRLVDRQVVERSSSFNALIRQLIRSERI